MSRKLDLINEALGTVVPGTRVADTSLNNLDTSAQVAIHAFNSVLRNILGAYAWTFMLKQKRLENSFDELSKGNSEFLHTFSLPENFDRMVAGLGSFFSSGNLSIFSLDSTAWLDLQIPFISFYKVEANYLRANVNPFIAVYLSNSEEDALQAPASFLNALVQGMRAEIAIGILQSPSLYNIYKTKFELDLRKAMNQDTVQARRFYPKYDRKGAMNVGQ